MPQNIVEIPTAVLNGAPPDLGRAFPSFIPQPEVTVYERIFDACNSRQVFPDDGSGLTLPIGFTLGPDISLYQGRDGSYLQDGAALPPIPVVRGWPAYPGSLPAIGVALANEAEDDSERAAQAGFAGDVFGVDVDGNVIATAAYYSEPLYYNVVVELIHTNRDERDRLHDQIRRVIYPLRHLLPSTSSLIREVKVSNGEKQDLPVDEQPILMYVSLFTVEVWGEAVIASEIVPYGTIDEIDVTVQPQTPAISNGNGIDYT